MRRRWIELISCEFCAHYYKITIQKNNKRRNVHHCNTTALNNPMHRQMPRLYWCRMNSQKREIQTLGESRICNISYGNVFESKKLTKWLFLLGGLCIHAIRNINITIISPLAACPSKIRIWKKVRKKKTKQKSWNFGWPKKLIANESTKFSSDYNWLH